MAKKVETLAGGVNTNVIVPASYLENPRLLTSHLGEVAQKLADQMKSQKGKFVSGCAGGQRMFNIPGGGTLVAHQDNLADSLFMWLQQRVVPQGSMDAVPTSAP